MSHTHTLHEREILEKIQGMTPGILDQLRAFGILTGTITPAGRTYARSELIHLIKAGPAVLVAALDLATGTGDQAAARATLEASRKATPPPPPPVTRPTRPPIARRPAPAKRYSKEEAADKIGGIAPLEFSMYAGMMGIHPNQAGTYAAVDVEAVGKIIQKS